MRTAVKHPWPAAVPGLKRPLTSWADFHPSGETVGNIRQRYIYETAADGGQTGRIKTVKNGGGIGMVIGAASSAITQYMFNGEINWKSVGVAAVGGFVSGAVAASPLGLTGQIGVGVGVGAVSYVADCKVNGSALKVDELAVSAAAGAVSGWIGGSGANQYKALSNTIKTASKTTARFTRLISTKGSASLAAKRIIYHCIYHLFILYCFLFF